MPLFQSSVVNKYIKSLNQNTITDKWLLFKNHFQNIEIQNNIRNSKEEQYQEGFLRDLFVNILGYTLNPQTNFNLTTEHKNIKDSKKADGAIIIDGKVIGIIELKGTNTTDLKNVEAQAFGYLNNQEGCKYVITSNFEKIRFYINNAIEYFEFNLFTLKENEFNLLYLCLSFENIKNSIPIKIKEESLSQEDNITKKLYKDYSEFKHQLYYNLIELNPQFDNLLLFKKSQKLIDRLLFILFGEDRGLLPPNSIREILKQWKQLAELDEYKPLYDRFKKYFNYLNIGHKGKLHDIFAYNGGLFKPDEVLDNVKIDDDILYKYSVKLSEYDYNSEVDVNILGHIFENSLNELDELKSEIEGQEVDKNKTKRKKDGVFYTPKYITKYIVENTVGRLCTQKKEELGINEEDYYSSEYKKSKTKKLKEENAIKYNKLQIYKEWLLHITIIDPACGSGAFLNEALNFLINEHNYIDELEAKLFGDDILLQSYENSILENNLFGVDVNEESVEIAKLSLWLHTAKPNRKLNSLNENIKCGNSLIDDKAIAGEKAFNWQNEFPKVFAKGGFDIVIGNPPYVQVNDSIYNNYETQKCADLYAYFFEKGLTIIKPKGYFSYITPSLFIKGMKFESLRNYILNNSTILEILDKGDKVFEEVQMPTAISILWNNKKEGQCWNCFMPNNIIIDKINNNSIQLNGISKIMRGLEIGKDKVLDEKDEIQFLTGEDIFRYGVKHISYIDK
ncbi:MAG: BREX-1 system adenine-specific DNA-methyltransferase PglX, partial [Bacilli bacterium]|nr:BREX-1 system adenine-specific DNA-methyltransferase PglX [Bacilli bacterium]